MIALLDLEISKARERLDQIEHFSEAYQDPIELIRLTKYWTGRLDAYTYIRNLCDAVTIKGKIEA